MLASYQFSLPSPSAAPVQCCGTCNEITTLENINIDRILAGRHACSICDLLSRGIETKFKDLPKRRGDVSRSGSSLMIWSGAPLLVRVCSLPRNPTIRFRPPIYGFQVKQPPTLPVGLPTLPQGGSDEYFASIKARLDICDKEHSCSKPQSDVALPTRLIHVGDADLDKLCLYFPKENESIDYVALSHCWGALPENLKEEFCTSDRNFEKRKKQFSASELPKTFQDAIRVTQKLGLKYLWIDSLCIIQWNDKDWKQEAGRMETVFSSAYLTIAATSALDSTTGFLERNLDNEYIFARDAWDQEFYVCTTVSDFKMEVENAKLNTRAWVLQERLLSRRTIHFAASQTYWECGEGIYCENLDLLTTTKPTKTPILDPRFPEKLLRTGHENTIEFLGSLFQDYSHLGITQKTDRAIAIAGLLSRIGGVRKCESRHGILENYLHSNLLWQRDTRSVNKLERISYDSPGVPSWSWMAYHGGIRPVDIFYLLTVEWCTTLRFYDRHGSDGEGKGETQAKDALITDLGRFQNCTLQQRNDILLGIDITYDSGESDGFEDERCVIVGREREKYYILVVRPTTKDGREYTRVGAGYAKQEYVVRDRRNVLIV